MTQLFEHCTAASLARLNLTLCSYWQVESALLKKIALKFKLSYAGLCTRHLPYILYMHRCKNLYNLGWKWYAIKVNLLFWRVIYPCRHENKHLVASYSVAFLKVKNYICTLLWQNLLIWLRFQQDIWIRSSFRKVTTLPPSSLTSAWKWTWTWTRTLTWPWIWTCNANLNMSMDMTRTRTC